MEYNFKDIYKSFNISYFSKNQELLNNFADSNLLKDYESIDYVNKKVMVILIKRFKLRISFSRTSNFSNEFIISDDYDFDPTLLNFNDSLLKIAVVKNNIDKWLSSKNLYNYDYIFAIEEYVNDLNDYKFVLKISAGTVYEEIKFILNELYRKKFEKFNLFIKNTDFDIFPNQKDYFKVLNSEYFADQWYRDMYNISDNTDCVIHFLLIGSDKGYDPGPDFSTFEYYETNKDVKKAGMNALIHYEKYGRKENRLMKISDKNQRDYEVILNSPLFDKEWYESTYDIEEDDSINHYLLTGYAKGYNPGPDFSTFQYYECNKDVKEENENPLVHYELFGRKEKRKFKFSDEEIQVDYELISNSPLFDKEWYVSNYDDVGDEDPVSHYLNIGYAKGYDPGPDFSTYEYYECNKDVRKYGMNALIHYEKYGRKENRFIWISDKNLRDYELILNSPLFDKEWYESTYDIEEDDSINHYLLTGYAKGYNPGPDFSTYEYYECNKDVKEENENPLVHYEQFGRKEKRKIHFSDAQHRIEYNMILNSQYFDEKWYESSYDMGRNVDPVSHYLNIGYAKGYNPGPDFSTYEYYECNKDVKEYGMNPLLHYERSGRKEQRKISLNDG